MKRLLSRRSTNATRQTFAVVFAGALTLSAGAPVGAQSFIEVDSVPTVLGVGLGVVPDYQGSDDYTAGVAPIFRYTFAGQERYVQLLANELTLNLVDSRKYRFGPVINYRFGRDDDVEDDRVKRMRELDGTVEAGVFGDIAWIDENNPRNRFVLGATLLQDIGDESDGFKARLSARGWQQVGRAVDINLGAGFVYADDEYTDHYFGVNANNVGSSGLPFFSADGGGQEYFLTAGAIVYLSKQWLLGAGVRYSNLTGDAADSPIVEDRGDETQWISGLAIAYMWR
jgi:MipA family protein